MMPKTTVRLIHFRDDRFCMLYLMQEKPYIRILRAWSAKECEEQPCEIPPPQLVEVDVEEAQSGWLEILCGGPEAAESATGLPDAAPLPDVSLCLDTLDHEVFDLMTCPLTVLPGGLC